MNRSSTTPTQQHAETLMHPMDEHNQRLIDHVHPSDWRNPSPDGRYNMIAIGAGAAGLVTVAGTAGVGGKAALIEKSLLGGDCLNVGCVPSKALIRCARAAAQVREAGAFGVRLPGSAEDITVDFPAIMERMRRLRSSIAPNDSATRFRDLGVDVYLGEAKFTGPDTIEVDGQTLRFARACVATGSRAVVPPIPGLKESGFLTNETVFSLTELPGRLGVLGGGPIGSELAQSFARFGSDVHLIEATDRIMPRDDEQAAQIVMESMKHDGVHLHTNQKLVEVQKTDGGKKLIIEDSNGTKSELEVDELLVAVGRTPNVDNLGLDEAGVQYDKRQGVIVDEYLRTSNKNIYAAGDVCFPYKFTHVGDALARLVIRNALFFGRGKTSALTIPWCTYTDPEVAHVGLHPHEAKEKGIDVTTIRIGLDDVDRAILEGETEGFLKVFVRTGKDEIIGATLVAPHAGDMISQITTAMTAGIGLGSIANTIHPYPTTAEVIKKAADQFNRTRLTPRVKGMFERLLAWRR